MRPIGRSHHHRLGPAASRAAAPVAPAILSAPVAPAMLSAPVAPAMLSAPVAPVRHRSRTRLCALAAAWAVIAGAAAPAAARSEKLLAYPRDQAWPAAVRFLVVDERAKVTDKDADAGYVVFELRDDGKTFRGSLEIVSVVRDGRSAVRFVLQIADRPSWLEIAMLGRLESKLRAELGSPAPPPDAPPRKPDEPRPRPDAPRPDGPKPDEPRPDDHALPISPTP